MAPSISFKGHLLLRVHRTDLSLPMLSLALLTGFTFSLTLPSAFDTIVPAMESLLFVSLPQLWQDLLSWVTPPCLFVLLNGIIVILTATSGSFSSTGSTQEAPDFSVMVKMLNVQEQSRPLEMAIVAVQEQEIGNDEEDDDEATKRERFNASEKGLQLVPVYSQSANGSNASINNEIEQANQEGAQEFGNKAIDKCDHDEVFYDVLADNDDECDNNWPEDAPLVPEDLRIEWPAERESTQQAELYKSGSQPNSCPHYHSLPSSPIKNNMRRSFSIDSAELSMSDEDFRKWIDDFISSKYAKLRREKHEMRVGLCY